MKGKCQGETGTGGVSAAHQGIRRQPATFKLCLRSFFCWLSELGYLLGAEV